MAMRPIKHLEMSPYAKYEIFKKAYDRVNEYKKKKDYLGAHVLSFCILEDRVTAAYVVSYRSINKSNPPNITALKKLRFKELINILLVMGVINSDLHEKLVQSAYKRNELMHEMMWRLDAFNVKNVDEIRLLINEVEKMTKKFITTHGTSTDLLELGLIKN